MAGRLLLVLLASLLGIDRTTPAGPGALSLLAGDLAGRAALAVLAWVLLASAASRLARVPGLLGSIAGALLRVLLPRAMRAAVLGLAGSQAVVGVALAADVPAGPHASVAPWAALAVQRPDDVPGVAVGSASAPMPPPPPEHEPQHGLEHEPAPRPAPPPPTVLVAPGDSLWTIAGRHLPAGASDADVAAAWPAWYDANRGVVGPDPDVLTVGTVLAVPPARAWSGVVR